MDYEEAIEWLEGKRSFVNIVPRHPFETWQERIFATDAAATQQAYWIAKAYHEGVIKASSHD